jgi:hypothetical protein
MGYLRGRFLLVLVLGVILTSCSGGGGGSSYNFQGRWLYEAVVTASSVPGVRPGDRALDILFLDQEGRNLSGFFASIPVMVMEGNCDPGARTFTIAGDLEGVTTTLAGIGSDETTLTGTMVMTGSGRRLEAAWTATLGTRALSAVAQPPQVERPGMGHILGLLAGR